MTLEFGFDFVYYQPVGFGFKPETRILGPKVIGNPNPNPISFSFRLCLTHTHSLVFSSLTHSLSRQNLQASPAQPPCETTDATTTTTTPCETTRPRPPSKCALFFFLFFFLSQSQTLSHSLSSSLLSQVSHRRTQTAARSTMIALLVNF